MNKLSTIVLVTLLSQPIWVFADCKMDLQRVATYSKKAAAARSQGNPDAAKRYYKRAARKLSAMKYSCSDISLKELSRKEAHYRKLADSVGNSNTGTATKPATTPERKPVHKPVAKKRATRKPRCGSRLPRARQLITQGRRTRHRRKRQANYAAAREMLLEIKSRCAGTRVAASANRLLARIRPKPSRSNSKKKSKVTRTRSVRRVARTAKNKRPGGNYPGRNSCVLKRLIHVYSVEQQAYKSLQEKNYVLAADRFVQAADGYESGSQKCDTGKGKVAVLDRAGKIRVIISNLKRDHIHCEKRLQDVRGLTKLAYKDEHAGEYELAQDGYARAVKGYVSMPQVCASANHLRELNENRAKKILMGCAHYVDGIKEYNKAFQAVSKARNRTAVAAYTKAARSFDLAIDNCEYNKINQRILNKLKVYSQRSVKRLTKK